MSTPEKYSHIDFTPPEGVRKEAEYGLKLRREYGRGGTAVGIARARDLANGVTLSPSTLRRMKAFFDRHQSDKSAPGFKRGDKEWPSNGLIASKLWGHSAGYSWAKKVVAQMNAADKKDSRSLRPKGSSMGIKPSVFVVHGPPSGKKAAYVASKKSDDDVVFDFNRVMDAISGGGKKERLVSYCTDIRTLIIDRAINRKQDGKTWIIATKVGDDLKAKLSDIPVEYIHIEATKDECLREIEGTDYEEEMRQVIDEYFTDSRSAAVMSGVERRFVGNFAAEDKTDPDLLRVERRADPSSGQRKTYVVGYAARFGTDSLLLGDFVERIDPRAFDLVEERQDSEGRPLETRCLYNHDPNHLLGRFPTTMRLTVDSKGLKYECLLPESRADIAESIERGDLKGSSFSFIVADSGGERWTTENGRSIRTVTKIKALLDCGPVTYPAYGDSTVAVAKRSYEQHRAFCATGKGGGVDNSCGGGAAQKWPPAGLVTTIGAVAGGAAGGVVGAAVGAHIGMAVDAYRQNSAIKSAEEETGVTVDKIDAFAKAIGKSMSVTSPKDGQIEATGGGVTLSVMTLDKNEVGKQLAGVVAHVSGVLKAPGSNDGVGTLAKTIAKAGKALGVDHVTVAIAASDKESVDKFRSAGFDSAIKSEDGNQLTMIKTVKKTSKRSIDSLRQFVAERRGFCPTGDGGGVDNSCGKNLEWDKSKDHKSPEKTKKAQDFIDKARKDQTTAAGKSGGKSDDGSGVQTWSKGDNYPWTVKQVGDSDGYLQGQHPDGSMTEKYPFSGGDTSSAEKKLRDELKQRTAKRYLDLRNWIEKRSAK